MTFTLCIVAVALIGILFLSSAARQALTAVSPAAW